MRSIKRVVDTGFWSDEKVMDFSPEDKYFLLFLLTNEYTTQLGIYYLPIKKAAFDLGYSEETVKSLLNDFEYKHQMLKYSTKTGEVALKNYLFYSVVSGGKPVLDCLQRDARAVRDKSLLGYIVNNLKDRNISNSTILAFIESLKELNIFNDNDNDNDNDSIVDESSTNRQTSVTTPKSEKSVRNVIPPTLDMVRAYCQERGNGIDPQHFIDYYEARGWMLKNGKMKDWQAAVRTWEGNQSSKPSQPSGITPAAKQINTMMTRDTGLSDLEARLVANWK